MSDGLPAAPVLETPRLRLRPFCKADWPAYAAMCADAEVMRHAFQNMRRDRVISLIRPGNQRSIAVAEGIGEKLLRPVELLGSDALMYEARP